MRIVLSILVACMTLASAAGSPAAIAPPVNGTYLSGDLGGPMLIGHFSESWVNPAGHGQVGNTVNAESWDGLNLGLQWRLWCPSIAAPPQLVADTRDLNGTGEVTYRTLYSGGLFWLSRLGPWSADNVADFTGTVQSFTVTTTYQYVFGQLLGIRSNIVTMGLFDRLDPTWGPNCLDFSIDNAAFYGTTDMGPEPPSFPPFLDPVLCPSDQPGLLIGGWGDVTHIALRITGCVVPIQPSTWGSIKARLP